MCEYFVFYCTFPMCGFQSLLDIKLFSSYFQGRSGFLWPGLNAPLIQGGRVQALSQRKKEERDRIQSEIIQQRDTWEKKRKIKMKREGGWSGKCWGGVLLDPPDPGPNGGKKTEFIAFLVLLAFLSRGWVKGRSRLPVI